jgi:hypothetical protein
MKQEMSTINFLKNSAKDYNPMENNLILKVTDLNVELEGEKNHQEFVF